MNDETSMFLHPYKKPIINKGGMRMRHEYKQFIHLFKDGQFDDLYHQMTDSCKSHYSMDAFHRQASSFHYGIRRYHLLNEMVLNGNRYVLWSDFRKEKLLSVQFNRMN